MRRSLFVCILSLIFAFSSTIASAAEAQKPFMLKIAAQVPGLNYYGYATTLSKLVEQYAPAGSKLEVIPRGGSMSNQTVLDQGKAELAVTHVGTSTWAWRGLPEIYEKHGKHQNIRFLTAGHISVAYVIALARRDYVQKTGLDNLEKMLLAPKPPRIIIKPQGSNVPPLVQGLLKGLGKDWDEFKKAGYITQIPQSQFSDMLRDDRADVYIDSVPHSHAGVTEILLTNDLVWVPMTKRILDCLANDYAHPTMTIPKTGFKGIPEEGYVTGGDGQTILIYKDVPNDIAYTMAKILNEHSDVMVEENGVLQGWDPAKNHETLNLEIPVHPGAAQYYKERGWMK